MTVNTICPFVLSETAKQEFDKHPGMLDDILNTLSVPRTGDSEKDIGRAVAFLAGPDASYITGCTLMVDGGGSFFSWKACAESATTEWLLDCATHQSPEVRLDSPWLRGRRTVR